MTAFACVASACPRTSTITPADGSSNTQDEGTSGACGTSGLTFASTSLVPHDARSAVLFDLEDPELDAALPLLARAADTSPLVETRLPVVVASDLAQWSFELRALSMHLDRVGLRPRHVVRTLSPSGAGVWIVPSDCDLTELRTRALRSWKFLLRQSAEGWVGIPGEDSTALWGTVVLPEDRLAFVPRTSFAGARAWISAHALSDATYSATLWSLPAAPIRAGLRTGGIRRAPETSVPSTSEPDHGSSDGEATRIVSTSQAPSSQPDPLQPVFFVVKGDGITIAPGGNGNATDASPAAASAATVAP